MRREKKSNINRVMMTTLTTIRTLKGLAPTSSSETFFTASLPSSSCEMRRETKLMWGESHRYFCHCKAAAMSVFFTQTVLNEAVIKTRLEEVFTEKRQLRPIAIIHNFSAAFLVSLTSSLNYSVAQTHRPPFDDVVKCFWRVENFHFFYDVNSGRTKCKKQIFHYCECASESHQHNCTRCDLNFHKQNKITHEFLSK